MLRLLGIFIAAQALVTPLFVSAHESQQKNGVVVFFHTNPMHMPVANKPAGIRILITKKEGVFKVEECTCTAKVLHKDEELSTHTLFADAKPSTLIPYKFAKSGIYSVLVSGTPKSEEASFEEFTMTFDVRVESEMTFLETVRSRIMYVISGEFLSSW